MPSAARLVNMSTSPKFMCARAWSGTDDKALVNFSSAAMRAAIASVTKQKCAFGYVRARRSDERVGYIVGIGGQRAIEKAARLCDHYQGLHPY